METQIEIKKQASLGTPADLISQAIDKGLGVDELGKLLDLQERWEANQARKAFFESFTNFQCDCPDLRKTKLVAFNTTQYKYAPLADITRQINPLLKKYELSYRWEIKDNATEITVTCLVSHIQGHTEKTSMMAAPDLSGAKNPIQGRGSAIEYLKRYTLIGALGLSTADSDIDGRLPEVDLDKLHRDYMEVYNQVIQLDPSRSATMCVDNWKTVSAKAYTVAIPKAKEVLFELQKKAK
jgi:hypothetical protein